MNLLETISDQYLSCTTDTKLIRFYHTQLIRRLTKLDRRMVLAANTANVFQQRTPACPD